MDNNKGKKFKGIGMDFSLVAKTVKPIDRELMTGKALPTTDNKANDKKEESKNKRN